MPLPPPKPALPPGVRAFDDVETTRDLIYSGTLSALQRRFPVSDGTHRLELSNVRYSGPQTYSLKQQKKALMSNRSLRTPVTGTWKLTDETTGKVLDEREDIVMHVPYYTQRGTIINRGNEYTIVNQARLKPGVYTRTKLSGEHEAQVNIKPGTGKNFRMWMEPSTGIFRVNVGQANIPAYPFLQMMGVTDEQMQTAWGPEVYDANRNKIDKQSTNKLYKRFSGYQYQDGLDDSEKIKYLKEAVAKFELDPEVVARTMGLENTAAVTPALLMRTTQKLLNISRGEEEEDDREAPQFANVLSIEDFMKERIDKDAGRTAKQLLFKSRRNKTLKSVPRGALNPYFQSLLLGSGLATPLEETNPFQILDQQNRIVKLGEGGITSAEAVTDDARDVNPGQAGFIDLISGPECLAHPEEWELFTDRGWKCPKDINEQSRLATLRADNTLTFNVPEKIVRTQYTGEIFTASSKFLAYAVTPNHRNWTRPYPDQASKWRFERADKSHDKCRYFQTGHEPYSGDPEISSVRISKDLSYPLNTWAAFLGWYLAEGSTKGHTSVSGVNKRCSVTISKVATYRPQEAAEIGELLDEMGEDYKYDDRAFNINNTVLAEYLHQFGKAGNKYIPEEALQWPQQARENLLRTLVTGDGRFIPGTREAFRKKNFVSTSQKLVDGVERIAISLGYPVYRGIEKDDREHVKSTNYRVGLHAYKHRTLVPRPWEDKTPYKVENYSGDVFCVVVPTGRFLVRYKGCTSFWTGNSEKIGIDVRAAYKTFKGEDQQLYAEFLNPKGDVEYLKPADVSDATVAFPGEDLSRPNNAVYALKGGKMQRTKAKQVDYQIPSYAHMYGPTNNMAPMPTGFMPSRAFYAAKYWSQYLPMVKGEAPLVQTQMPDSDLTFSEHYGRKVGTLSAKGGGVVTKVTNDSITITNEDGKKQVVEMVQNFPFNRLTAISYFPTVKSGDVVNPGDMLAHSNFSDKKTGAMNMGVNLKTAVVPYKGFSFEDAYVISESAAQKLASERLYGFDKESRNNVEIGLNKFTSAFPKAYTTKQLESMGKDGVVREGSVVHKGDPIILAVGPKLLSSEDAELGKLHKALRNSFRNEATEWEYSTPGVVTDVGQTTTGVKVNIKSQTPSKVGDKLSNLQASKGIIGKIIADEEMPKDTESGEPYEMLLNPMVVLSRVAPNQLVELQLAKIAKKTGKPYKLPSTPPAGMTWTQFGAEELKKHGLEESRGIYDPELGREIKGLGEGYMYMSAFHHLAEKKLSGRDVGGYTADHQPGRGSKTGAKKMCFPAHQKVMTLDGEKKIGHIVEKRRNELVWAPDDQGTWGYYKITNWWTRRGLPSELLNIRVANVYSSTKTSYYRNLHPTRNHEIYRYDGAKVRADALKVGDQLASWGYTISKDQRSLLVGSMLGDAAICDLGGSASFYSDMHSDKQRYYLEWKDSILNPLTPTGVRTSMRDELTTGPDGGFAKTGKRKRVATLTIHRHDVAKWLENLFYRDKVKVVTDEALSVLTPIGLVAWFLDDGCVHKRATRKDGTAALTGTIATHGFKPECRAKLAEFLSSTLAAKVTVTKAGALCLSASACTALSGMTAWYVPFTAIPKSKIYLRAYAKAQQESGDVKLITPCVGGLGTVPAEVISISPYRPYKGGVEDEINLYDLEVEGVHRYCASNLVVSNSSMDVNALLAHGAPEVLKDSHLIRGTKNEDFWNALRMGRPLPEPGVPFVYEKFMNTMKAGGINIKKKGDILEIMPLTTKDVASVSSGAVNSARTINSRTLDPIKGGLFDQTLTGGMQGKKWTHVDLAEPIVNPVMEEPVRRLLGLKARELSDVIAGRHEVGGSTGGKGLRAALAALDVDKEIEKYRLQINASRGAKRDNAVKALRYLVAAKKQDIHPEDWIIDKVPVIPPIFRPISQIGDVLRASDMNELYRDLIETNNGIKTLRKDLPGSALADERLQLYKAVTAAVGLGEPITPEGVSKRWKGAIRQVIGTSPKTGLFQSKVLSKTVDVVGRGVVAPDPSLDMDSVGIPEDKAWVLYRPFVTRKLVRRGFPPHRAAEMVENRTKEAEDMLLQEMKDRPVLLDRAPTWHKFNLLAFTPHIVKEDVIRVSPLIVGGFNMDFDGDTANFHVPVSDKAVKQAKERMMPSRNLFRTTDLQSPQHTPGKEMVMGLYQLTRKPTGKPPVVFKNKREAKEAYRKGMIGPNDPIIIQG